MRLRTVVASLTALAGCALTMLAGPAAADDPIAPDQATTHYYVALGDSLSQGYMPGQGDTDLGYVDAVYQTLLAKDPTLQLVKLGCSGETTATMIDGGRCADRYPVGTSQLDVAEQFLRDHAGAVTYLTMDIGANDVTACAAGGSIDPVCLAQGAVTIGRNLNTILAGLRDASGTTRPVSVGMAYYDPFLQQWLNGFQGQLVAIASVAALATINTTEGLLYASYGFRVADATTAFHTGDFLTRRFVAGYGTLPTNVAYICQYTYMCSRQDIHTNAAGYQLLAGAFLRRLG
jgi:lysophospholipase L1-like esterase